jgi:hypothetical protein
MVTMDEDYPGVYVTREPRTEGVKLYGPFTSVYALKEAVTMLQKAFKFRTCHLDIRPCVRMRHQGMTSRLLLREHGHGMCDPATARQQKIRNTQKQGDQRFLPIF